MIGFYGNHFMLVPIFVSKQFCPLSLRHLSQYIAAIASDWGVQG